MLQKELKYMYCNYQGIIEKWTLIFISHLTMQEGELINY